MAEIASPIARGINSARGIVTPRSVNAATPDPAVVEFSSSIGIRLDRISGQMFALNSSLDRVSGLIGQNALLERQKEFAEQNRERLLAERQIREGQEALVERKIENALVKPVQKTVAKTQSTLSRLMGLFTFLLGGWLVGKTVEGIRSLSKLNLGKLTELKNIVPKGLNAASGIFKNIAAGLGVLTGSIIRTTSRIGNAISNGLFKAPVQALINAVKGVFKGGNTTPSTSTPSTTAPSGGGLPGSPSSAIGNTLRGVANFFGNPFVMGTAGTAANMASGSSFGEAVFGSGTAVAGLTALARTPFIPFPFKALAGLALYQPFNEAGKSVFQGASSFMSNFQLPKGIDYSQLYSAGESMKGTLDQTVSAAYGTLNIAPASVEPAATASGQKADSVGPVAEAPTNVVVTAAAPPQPRVVPADANGVANRIPSISSSNPDNFYVYYSMANYNVVA